MGTYQICSRILVNLFLFFLAFLLLVASGHEVVEPVELFLAEH